MSYIGRRVKGIHKVYSQTATERVVFVAGGVCC